MRVLALTVGKNESRRYLAGMLKNTAEFVDEHFFYDDQSTDDTVDIARELFCWATVRPETVPSFMDHEAAFRAAAWAAFEEAMQPRWGDWVLVIDCDEFFTCRASYITDKNAYLKGFISEIDTTGAVMLDIPEVFGFDDEGCPLIRIDRLWGTIHAPRLLPYQSGATFFMQKMGAPSVPSYVMTQPWVNTEQFVILHYGYAQERDQITKHKRYSALLDNGHSNEHIQSIVAPDKELVPWRP